MHAGTHCCRPGRHRRLVHGSRCPRRAHTMSSISASSRPWGGRADEPSGGALPPGLGGGLQAGGELAAHADPDVATERVGDRAEIGRLPDHLLEECRLESGHLCADRELDRRYSRRATSSSVQAALTATRSGGVLFSPSTSASAIAKQLAWAPAISSSGLVLPSGRSVRDAQVTASWSSAPLPLVRVPAPRASGPPPRGSRLHVLLRHGSPSV
jgi:hypothetical protein